MVSPLAFVTLFCSRLNPFDSTGSLGFPQVLTVVKPPGIATLNSAENISSSMSLPYVQCAWRKSKMKWNHLQRCSCRLLTSAAWQLNLSSCEEVNSLLSNPPTHKHAEVINNPCVTSLFKGAGWTRQILEGVWWRVILPRDQDLWSSVFKLYFLLWIKWTFRVLEVEILMVKPTGR